MDIGVVALSRVKEKDSFSEHISNLLSVRPVELLVAPEYTNYEPEQVRQLSLSYNSTAIFPGTRFVEDRCAGKVFVVGEGYLNGKIFVSHAKKTFSPCSADYQPARHYPGGSFRGMVLTKGNDVGTFLLPGLKGGLEICSEHAPQNRTLQRDAIYGSDLQIVVGCGLPYFLDLSSTLRLGGFGIVADSGQPHTQVVRQELGGVVSIPPISRLKFGVGSCYDIYSIDLERRKR